MAAASVTPGSIGKVAHWERVLRAHSGTDERELWLAWRVAFQRRFWKDLGERSASAACQSHGINHVDILRRLTAYEFSAKRDKTVDLAQLEREIASK